MCVGVAGRLHEIIGNRNTHTHTLSHTGIGVGAFSEQDSTNSEMDCAPSPLPYPNNPVNTPVPVLRCEKITNGPVHVKRVLIIFANSDGSGGPAILHSLRCSHTQYMIKIRRSSPTSWLRMCVQSLIPHDA